MGVESSKTSRQEQQAAKSALSDMCEAVSKAMIEVAKLEDPDITEPGIAETADQVLKLCGEQVQQTANELTRLVKREKLARAMRQTSDGGDDKAGDLNTFQQLHANLLFLELLRIALNDGSQGEDDEKSGPEGSSGTEIAHPWTRAEELGKGGFGVVHAAVDKNGLKFAVKEVPKDGVEEKALREEIKFLGQLSHKNIVKLFGCAGDKENFYMYMELMEGSVRDKIQKSGEPILPNVAKKYTRDLLQGLMYLHSKDVIHRDIKCANVLLDASDTAKLADMGASKNHDHATLVSHPGEIAGTFYWMSPEVIGGQQGGKRSDIWSVGCTVYEMVRGKPPFAEEVPPAVILFYLPPKIKNLEHKDLVEKEDDLGPSLQSFLQSIFVKMDERPFVEQLAGHHWAR